MRSVYLFPGQGAQEPGMLARLPRAPEVQATLAEASGVLGRDVRGLDQAAALAGTVEAQLALLIAATASVRTLEAAGARPDAMAGHSVGAFGAAVAAGVLGFADAVRSVRIRGELMAAAFPEGFGMLAVIGLPEPRLAPLLERAREGGPVHLANRNAPTQIVAAGAAAALETLGSLALAAGARKASRLNVAVPSHCPLLEPVARQLRAALAELPLKPPKIPYVSGSCARLLSDPEAIRADLAGNVALPVRWHDTTVLLRELGAKLFVQLPPGAVLAELAAAAFPEARSVAVAGSGIESAAWLMARAGDEKGASA